MVKQIEEMLLHRQFIDSFERCVGDVAVRTISCVKRVTKLVNFIPHPVLLRPVRRLGQCGGIGGRFLPLLSGLIACLQRARAMCSSH